MEGTSICRLCVATRPPLCVGIKMKRNTEIGGFLQKRKKEVLSM
jgi:hypothetical protein